MIENEQLLNRMASEWIKELMHSQCEFSTLDVLQHMPLKHLGFDFDTMVIGDPERTELFDMVAELIPVYAKQYGYAKSNGKWKQANMKPEPWLEADGENDGSKEQVELCDAFNNHVKKMKALLGADPDVTVLADQKANVINISVSGCDKPDAYRLFFQGQIEIKGVAEPVTLLVNGHKKSYKTTADVKCVREMLSRHPLVDSFKMTTFPDGSPNRFFVLWKNTTVQFVNDNFGSLYCATTTTPEALAKEVLKGSGMVIWWSTASELPLAETTGEIVK